MEQNKTGKYLKYAIGEIVLVVVGILIALSINNWNEQRKESIHEVKILKQLKTDLVDNLEEVKSINRNVQRRKDEIDSILVYFDKERPVDESLRSYFTGIRGGSIFNSANTTYKNLENSGKQILTNDSLRAAITEMYERDFKNITLRTAYEDRIKLDHLEVYMYKHFKSYPRVVNDTIRYIATMTEPIDINKLSVDYEFENLLRNLRNQLRVRGRWLKNTLDDLVPLIESIQTEINRLEK